MRHKVRKSEQTLARDFPHCVEIVVPLGGFGRTLDLMHAHLRSIAHITGLPLDARSITDELTSMEGK